MEFLASSPSTLEVIGFVNETAVFWLPFVLGVIAWKLWIDYKRREWIANIDWSLLEVRLPQEIERSPLAMEIVLAALHDSSEGTWIDRYYKGRVRLWSSLELVSLEGSVRFYIRVPEKTKNALESKIYSQYPGIEIFERDDYTDLVDYYNDNWDITATDFKFTKPDPHPILTYVDYGLDKPDLDAENQVDPIAPLIELMGSIKQDEHLWLQILIQPTKKRFQKKGSFIQKTDWKARAEELVGELRGDTENFNSLNIGTQNAIAAIQRGMDKIAFDCGIRAVYLTKRQDKSINLPTLIGTMKQFSSEGRNGFAPREKTDFDFPWEDFQNRRLNQKKREMFDAYKRRSYFAAPYKKPPMVLNAEELATIYHFPARITETPGFARVDSQKSEPPANLPT